MCGQCLAPPVRRGCPRALGPGSLVGPGSSAPLRRGWEDGHLSSAQLLRLNPFPALLKPGATCPTTNAIVRESGRLPRVRFLWPPPSPLPPGSPVTPRPPAWFPPLPRRRPPPANHPLRRARGAGIALEAPPRGAPPRWGSLSASPQPRPGTQWPFPWRVTPSSGGGAGLHPDTVRETGGHSGNFLMAPGPPLRPAPLSRAGMPGLRSRVVGRVWVPLGAAGLQTLPRPLRPAPLARGLCDRQPFLPALRVPGRRGARTLGRPGAGGPRGLRPMHNSGA